VRTGAASAPARAAGAPRDPWIGALFGPDVLTGSLPIEAGDPDALPAAEAALAARFAPARRREFAAGRQCARRLLQELGADAPSLLSDEHRAPGWPPGVVGSIAHGAGLCVVALARRGAVRGLGVDVECDAPIGPAVRRRVCTEGEERLLAGADESEAGRVAKLLFGAKEAIFKCVHPLWRRPLGLRDVEVRLDRAASRFHARALPVAGPGAGALVDAIEGFYAIREGRVLAGATLRAPAGAAP
jgi:4'-phosphopantetheinyl transferase EntD